MKFKNAYSPSADDPGVDCSKDVPLTKQADMDAADINNILARYQRTGMLPEMIKKDPTYGDFSDVASFQEALEIVAHAEDQFAMLDAPIRARFDNDPAKFLAFAENPQNMSEMVKMGLATPRNDGTPEVDPTPSPASPSPSRARAGRSPAAPGAGSDPADPA